jgi:hypothetical protein
MRISTSKAVFGPAIAPAKAKHTGKQTGGGKSRDPVGDKRAECQEGRQPEGTGAGCERGKADEPIAKADHAVTSLDGPQRRAFTSAPKMSGVDIRSKKRRNVG